MNQFRLTRCTVSDALRAFAWVAVAMALGPASAARAEVVHFVAAEAGGAGDGTSWDDAFNDLQEALGAAQSGDQIWVAAGIYKPSARTDPDDARSATFHLMSGVGIYGGFAGFEDSLDERDFEANETILSGDLNGDDIDVEWGSDCCTAHPSAGCDDLDCEAEVCALEPSCCLDAWDGHCASWAVAACNTGACETNGNASENSYHVVTGSGTDETARLNGFTITAGNADGIYTDPESWGGGMLNIGGSPTVAHCRFSGNVSHAFGAGMYNGDGSSPHVVSCTFAGNMGGPVAAGIGMSNMYGSSPTLVNCTFMRNVAPGLGIGAGIHNAYDCDPLLVNCRFIENTASGPGGAFTNDSSSNSVLINCSFLGNQAVAYGGGAVFNVFDSNLLLVNCLFSGNSAYESGGAIKHAWGADATLVNCTLSENAASVGGGIYWHRNTEVTLANSILWGNSDDGGSGESAQISWEGNAPIVDYSCIEGLTGALGGVGNIGNDPLFVNAVGFDGVAGTTDDDLRLSPGSPCIDAADNAAVPPDVGDLDGDGNTTEPTPLDFDGNPRFLDDEDTPDTGAGTPPIVDMGALEFLIDCNRNHVRDDVDIASGTSEDSDGNGVPDECEAVRSIEYTVPSDSAIDARQPHDLSGGPSHGWWIMRLVLDGPSWDLAPADFTITEAGGDGDAPGIAGFSREDNSTVVIMLDAPIEPGAWTIITHLPSGTSSRLGYLPADVDGDGTSGPRDVLALIDAINGVRELPDHAVDINRDGTLGPLDILCEIDLLTGAGSYDPWNWRSLPD